MNRAIWTWMALGLGAAAAVLAGVSLDVTAWLGLVGLLVLVAAGAIAMSVQLDAPFIGLAVLLVTAVAFPFEFRGISGVMMSTSLPLAAAVCGLWLARLVVYRRATVDRSRLVYACAAFVGVAVLSFAIGLQPLFPAGGAPVPAQVVELGLFVLSACLLLAVGHQVSSVAHLRWLTWLFIAAGTVTCALQMMPSLAFIARWTTRPGSVGSLFWTWLVAVSVSQALFNRTLNPWGRLACLAVTGAVLYHGLIQIRSWASGWLPALVALGAIVFLRVPRLTVALGALGLPIGLVVADYLSTALMAEEEYSLMTRQEAWRVLWQLVEMRPLLGSGPANYYYYTENFPLLGWYVRFISHNNYQDLLVQTGVLGLLAFAWVAFEAGWLALRLYLRVPAGFERAYVAGAFGGLAGSLAAGMLGDWIVPFYYNAGVLGFRSSLLFWVFLGGVLAIKRIRTRDAMAEVASLERVPVAPASAHVIAAAR